MELWQQVDWTYELEKKSVGVFARSFLVKLKKYRSLKDIDQALLASKHIVSFPAGLPFGRRAWKVLASYEAEVIYSDLFVRVRRETPEHDVTPDRSHARRFLFAAFLEVVVVCSGLILML